MKKILLFIAVSMSSISFAQNTKEVGEFSKLNVYDKIELTLKQGKEFKIELEGANSNDVQIVNKNGRLKVKMSVSNSLQGGDVKAILYYNTLDEIIAEEGAKITSKEQIKSNLLAISAKTGGNVELKVDADKLTIKSYTGGTVNLTGKANVQDILSSAGGFIRNAELSSKQTMVTVNAGGSAEIKASELVDAKTRAGGYIRIYGKPKTINQKTIAGGSITQVDK
ncbi:MAG: DUF2807 domain-containing protein [Flavobacteriaceae bacterium]|jgi:hypothetical protein|nr:DUF2807 domain-containing protein [Flavobacteriaceae bacterium]